MFSFTFWRIASDPSNSLDHYYNWLQNLGIFEYVIFKQKRKHELIFFDFSKLSVLLFSIGCNNIYFIHVAGGDCTERQGNESFKWLHFR